jgi:hypothetical protein
MPSAYEVDVLGVFLFAGKEENLLRGLVGFPHDHDSVERESVCICTHGRFGSFLFLQRTRVQESPFPGWCSGWLGFAWLAGTPRPRRFPNSPHVKYDAQLRMVLLRIHSSILFLFFQMTLQAHIVV